MAETFGKTDKGSTKLFEGGLTHIYACKYQSGSVGSLASISVYIKYSGTGKIKCAMYDSDRRLIENSKTEEKTIQLGQDGWMTFNFLTPPSITASTDYWLACFWEPHIYLYKDAGSPSQFLYDTQAYNNWPPGPLGGPYLDWALSIYATYTVVAPTTPTDLLCNGETNPTELGTLIPYFSAIYNDPNAGDIAQNYRIQANTASDFAGTSLWDSGKTSMSNVNEGERCGNIDYAGNALTEGTTYYWRIKFWDDEDNEGAWSSASNFRALFTPTYPTDLRLSQCPQEFNPIEIKQGKPRFSAIYNDPNTGDIANNYQIQVNTNSSFSGTEIWNSGKTSMDNLDEGERCPEILYQGIKLTEDGTTYYWRIKFWDDEDNEGAWSDPGMFTMAGVRRRDSLLLPTRGISLERSALSPIREISLEREILLPSDN